MAKLHARFWKYDGKHLDCRDCERYDPHQLGLKLISGMAYLIETEYSVNGVSLDNATVRHHKPGQSIDGHQVHVAATREQWDAAREYLERLFPGSYK